MQNDLWESSHGNLYLVTEVIDREAVLRRGKSGKGNIIYKTVTKTDGWQLVKRNEKSKIVPFSTSEIKTPVQNKQPLKNQWHELCQEYPRHGKRLICYAGGYRGFDKDFGNRFNVMSYDEDRCCFFSPEMTIGVGIITHWAYFDELDLHWVDNKYRPQRNGEIICFIKQHYVKEWNVVVMDWSERSDYDFDKDRWHNPTSEYIDLEDVQISHWAVIPDVFK